MQNYNLNVTEVLHPTFKKNFPEFSISRSGSYLDLGTPLQKFMSNTRLSFTFKMNRSDSTFGWNGEISGMRKVFYLISIRTLRPSADKSVQTIRISVNEKTTECLLFAISWSPNNIWQFATAYIRFDSDCSVGQWKTQLSWWQIFKLYPR